MLIIDPDVGIIRMEFVKDSVPKIRFVNQDIVLATQRQVLAFISVFAVKGLHYRFSIS